jgi:hypothetical protein
MDLEVPDDDHFVCKYLLASVVTEGVGVGAMEMGTVRLFMRASVRMLLTQCLKNGFQRDFISVLNMDSASDEYDHVQILHLLMSYTGT